MGYHSEPATDLTAVGFRVEPKDLQAPACARAHGTDHLHSRTLASAVWPQDTEGLARLHRETNTIYGNKLAEMFCEPFGH